jgi:nucleoside-diphosphate-sugar epimerase
MRVLITGAFGWTATAIIETLSRARHEITVFDLPSVACPQKVKQMSSRVVLGDVADCEAVKEAARFADVIIHLAVAVGEEDYLRSDAPFTTNVQGTYNIFEAARINRISKVVLMSSAAVHLPFSEKTTGESVWRSSDDRDHLYDLTKRLQETIAQDFCETYKMAAIVLRAGHIVDGKEHLDPNGKSLDGLDYARGGWVCRYDLANACLKAVEYSGTGYQVFHIIGSKRARDYFDIERAEEELKFKVAAQFERYE